MERASKEEGMNVLITGGAGFIGSHLTDYLLSKKHNVVVFDNFSLGKKEFVAHHLDNPHFSLRTVDLLQYKKLVSLWPKNIDMVFHLAANSDIRKGAINTRVDFDQTIVATFNVLNVMRKKGVGNIFFTSGSGVYGDLGRKRIDESYGPLKPVSLYGATKLSAEALISAYAHLFNLRAWIVRPANIIGPRATHGVVYDFVRKLRKNPRQLTILGDGNQTKSYLHILDALSAINQIWKKARERVSFFNLSSDSTVSVNSIANIVIREMKLKGVKISRTGGYGGWKGDVPIVRITNTKLARLGWKSMYSASQAVTLTVRSLLQEGI